MAAHRVENGMVADPCPNEEEQSKHERMAGVWTAHVEMEGLPAVCGPCVQSKDEAEEGRQCRCAAELHMQTCSVGEAAEDMMHRHAHTNTQTQTSVKRNGKKHNIVKSRQSGLEINRKEKRGLWRG